MSIISKAGEIQEIKKKTYRNLADAVIGCLRSQPQQPMSINSICEWILTNTEGNFLKLENLKRKIRKRVTTGCDRFGWTRVGRGVYQWNETKKDNSPDSEKSLAITVPTSSPESNIEGGDRNYRINSKTSENLGFKSSKFINFPDNEKLDKYQSLKEIVKAALKELAPTPIKTYDIIDWLYPKGLPDSIKKLIYPSINKTLREYAGYNWRKLERGIYVWDESLV